MKCLFLSLKGFNLIKSGFISRPLINTNLSQCLMSLSSRRFCEISKSDSQPQPQPQQEPKQKQTNPKPKPKKPIKESSKEPKEKKTKQEKESTEDKKEKIITKESKEKKIPQLKSETIIGEEDENSEKVENKKINSHAGFFLVKRRKYSLIKRYGKPHTFYTPRAKLIEEYEEKQRGRKVYSNRSKLHDLYVGDMVKVIEGKFKGKVGKIKRIDIKNKKVKVEGVNLKQHVLTFNYFYKNYYSKDIKPKIKYFSQYIPLDTVKLFSPDINQPITPIIKKLKDRYVRYCPLTKKIIPLPEKRHQLPRYRCRHYKRSELDTSESVLRTVTFKGIDYAGVVRQFLDMIDKKNKIEKKLILKDKMVAQLV